MAALAIMAGVMALVALILAAVLAAEATHGERRVRRNAPISTGSSRVRHSCRSRRRGSVVPSRGLVGAGLVALGALMILLRRDEE